MIFFLILLILMFGALVIQHFIGPLPMLGCRLLLMQMLMLYGAIALPLHGMLVVTFIGGLMWDALQAQQIDGAYQISMGWSVAFYMGLGTIMAGFRPLFLRGRWEVHCLLTGVLTAAIPLAEFIMVTVRTEPVQWIFDKSVAWRIGGAGLIATLLSPLLFFVLNYLAVLTGYDPQPERGTKPTIR
ncbi:MAG: hypothetical protein ABMA13_06300 [Chthoniobacteraceae bacterium]